MRIRPGLLFWGIFFLLLGGLPLLVRAGVLDPNALADLWRLWPLLLVSLGISLILGRTSAGILGTVVAAVVLGLAAGGVLASGTNWIGNAGGCGAGGSGTGETFEQSGTFSGPMTAQMDLDCGSIDLSVQPGSDWRVRADYQDEPPTLELSDQALGLRSPEGFGLRRQEWTIALPADQLEELELDANASSVTASLAGAQLTTLVVDLNAGEARIDADTTGSMSANAGAMELCVPPDATLRFRVEEQLTFAHDLDDRGLVRSGDVWTREGAVGAPVIDLSIEGNAANFTLDPAGGC